MANFTFNWSDGAVTSIPLSGQTGFSCSHKTPDSRMNSAANEIVMSANDGQNLNDVEQYCSAAYSAIGGMLTAAKNIRDRWDIMEIECAKWDNWTRSCSCCNVYCYMNENALESAYYAWKPVVPMLADAQAQIMTIWQQASAQLVLDNQQATSQATLDDLIAQTNNTISLTTYQNEQRELSVAKRKTKEIFLPIMIGLVILGAGFYFIKK